MLQIRNVLLATDFSKGAECALDQALSLARRFEARLHVIHVATAPDRFPMAMDLVIGDYKEEAFCDLESQAASELEKLLEARRIGDVQVEKHVHRGEAAAPVVLTYAEENRIDVIVTGSHGRRGARRFMLGSTSEEIAREADCPVLVARTCEHALSGDPPGRVLVPVDFSEYSREAVSCGRELAAAYEVPLDLVHVVEEAALPGVYGLEEGAEQVEAGDVRAATTRALRQLLATPGPDVQAELHVLDGHPPSVIAQFAEERETGLIAMASHGRTGLEHLLMGSVAERVMRQASCPVFVVKSFGKSLLPERAS